MALYKVVVAAQGTGVDGVSVGDVRRHLAGGVVRRDLSREQGKERWYVRR